MNIDNSWKVASWLKAFFMEAMDEPDQASQTRSIKRERERVSETE